jgi:hypothetical protein
MSEIAPQYKLILLKTVPGKCDSDDNLKIIGFTMPESFGSVFSVESLDNATVAEAISKAGEDMKLDDKITRDNLIQADCSSKTQPATKPAEPPAGEASSTKPDEGNAEEGKPAEVPPEEGTPAISGGAKKQSKRKRDYKNRRNRRSQKK